jgi:transcriptional regulator with XRE-family HTH domain
MSQQVEKSQEPVAGLVARRVRELRDRRGWSAQELANRCADAGWPQLDRGVLANLENGRRRSVSIDEVLVLALVLDVAPVHLVVPTTDRAVQVGKWIVGSGPVREWVRGNYPLPSQDSRIYRTEVPDVEWAAKEQRLVSSLSEAELQAFFLEAHGQDHDVEPGEED